MRRADETGQVMVMQVAVSAMILLIITTFVVRNLMGSAQLNSTVSTRDQAMTLDNQVLSKAELFGCGSVTGANSASTLQRVMHNCSTATDPNLADTSFTDAIGPINYQVTYRTTWMNTTNPPASCSPSAYQGLRPTLLQQTATARWTINRVAASRSMTLDTTVPPDALATHLASTGAIIVPTGKGGQASLTGVPASVGVLPAPITHTADANGCVWFPFLPPGTYEITTEPSGSALEFTGADNDANNPSQSITVTAGQTVMAS